MSKWSYEVEGWKGRHIKVNGLGWASIDDMFRAHNYDVEKMEKQIFDLAAQNAETQEENNRLDRELDEARKRIAELEQPLRVPFSDDQIERMAREASYSIGGWGYDNWDKGIMRDAWRDSVRRALAAGGLEPCADPADVAISTPIIADLHKQLEAARREVDEVRRHIGVTMSREHQARKEAQETKRELSHLHPGETVDGVIVERDHYRIRLERAEQDVAALRAELAELRDQIDDDNTNAAAVNDLLIQLQNVTAERDEARAELAASEIELADKAFYVREFAAVSEERDAARAEKQTLSDELQRVTAERDDARAELAAIAHLRKRPEGLPTAEEIGRVSYWSQSPGSPDWDWSVTGNAILSALAPWLREPVGWELDVTADDALRVYARNHKSILGMQAVLDLCRSRIRPVYECKECAKKEAEYQDLINATNDEAERINRAIDAINTALAALEGSE